MSDHDTHSAFLLIDEEKQGEWVRRRSSTTTTTSSSVNHLDIHPGLFSTLDMCSYDSEGTYGILDLFITYLVLLELV